MKLEVKMYVRTTKGQIFQLIKKDYDTQSGLHSDKKVWITNIKGYIYTGSKFKNASFNIIDLIEVGDYVNGIKVVDNKHSGQYQLYPNGVLHSCHMVDYIAKSSEIKSIVTKEQFESCEFKIID